MSPCRLLYSLAFNARFLRHLWHLISSMTTKMITGWVNSKLIFGKHVYPYFGLFTVYFCWRGFILSVCTLSSMVALLQLISRGSPMSLEDSNRIIPLFYLFSSLFSHSLISVHDSEFFGHEMEGTRLYLLFMFNLDQKYSHKKIYFWFILWTNSFFISYFPPLEVL